jgi:hypothetical protein
MELFSTAMQQTKDNSKEFSRLGVDVAKAFHEASNDIVTVGVATVEKAGSTQRR